MECALPICPSRQLRVDFFTNLEASVDRIVLLQCTEAAFPIFRPCPFGKFSADSPANGSEFFRGHAVLFQDGNMAKVSYERMHLMEQHSVRVRAVAIFENFRKVTLNIGTVCLGSTNNLCLRYRLRHVNPLKMT